MPYWILSFWGPRAPFLHLSHIILHWHISCTDLKFFRVKDCHAVFLIVYATSGPKFQPLAPFFSVRDLQFWLSKNRRILLVWRELFITSVFLNPTFLARFCNSNSLLLGDVSYVLSDEPSVYVPPLPIHLTISYA